MFSPLYLKKNEDRRLRTGHLWIFSNEVDMARSPLSSFDPGQQVIVCAADKRPLGIAYINPHSLICARLISRDPDRGLDEALLVQRLRLALALRERCFDAPCYRLVFGEGDFLPGLIVDRYHDSCVVQLTTLGMEQHKEAIINALLEVLQPAHIILRNDGAMRTLEGMPRYVEVCHGEPPGTIALEENGCHFHVDPLGGQKTGWYYDHRANRARLATYVRGQRVLDLFCYCGAWGIQAARAGAREVVCVDNSRPALERVRENAALNQLGDKVTAVQGDIFDTLQTLQEAGEHFDVVILDPPAFIKRKKDLAVGSRAYRRINQLAIRLLQDNGLLISASCSYHMKAEHLMFLMQQAACRSGRALQILEQGHQGTDHPVHPAIPETAYLKSFCARLPGGF